MRLSPSLLNPIITNPRAYLNLKKIQVLHFKNSNHLFIQPLTSNVLNILNRSLFTKKTTKNYPKNLQNVKRKLIRHPIFLSLRPYIFTNNKSNTQVLTITRSESLQHKFSRRSVNRQNRRTKTLLKHLLVTSSKNTNYTLTSNFSTNLNNVRRYKLLQTLPYGQILSPSIPRPTDTHKLFNLFLTLLKLYKRGSRKQITFLNHKTTKNIRPLTAKPKKTFLDISSSPSLNYVIPSVRKKRILKKTTHQCKILKKPNLYYNWTREHLNMSRSLQPTTQYLVLLKQTPQTYSQPNLVQHSKQPLTKQNPQVFTPFLRSTLSTQLTTSKPQQTFSEANNTRFGIGAVIPSLTALTLPSLTQPLKLNLQESINFYVQKFSFVTTLTTKKFLSVLVSQTKLLSSRNTWETLFSQQVNKNISHNYAVNRPSKVQSWSRYQADDLYINTRLTHIRFKPGYSRQWRTFRNEFTENFNLPNRYQYRLTRYLAGLHATQRLHQNKNSTLLLKHSLVESKLAPNLETSIQYITRGLTFLNGSLASNPNLYLTQHDFVQLVVSLKYYTVIKWQISQTFKNKSILAKLLWKRGKNWRRSKFTFPNWVLNFNTTFLDTPLYLEVDHFSLSLYVLTTNYNKPNGMQQYPQILPLYNWKYII